MGGNLNHKRLYWKYQEVPIELQNSWPHRYTLLKKKHFMQINTIQAIDALIKESLIT